MNEDSKMCEAEVDSKESEVRTQMVRLDKTIMGLATVTASLVGRLRNVCTSHPETAGNVEDLIPELVPLASELYVQSDSLDRIVQTLNDLIDRIEL